MYIVHCHMKNLDRSAHHKLRAGQVLSSDYADVRPLLAALSSVWGHASERERLTFRAPPAGTGSGHCGTGGGRRQGAKPLRFVAPRRGSRAR